MKNKILFSAFGLPLLLLVGCFNANDIQHRPADVSSDAAASKNVVLVSNPTKNKAMESKFYDFKFKTLDGQEVSFEKYRGKKVVVLNVASECGYTPQYADWEKFYEENKEKVVVLGFPCNQFGGQEPGDAGTIQSFCKKNYGVTFPIFEKIEVKGAGKSPLYAWLTDKTANGWNEKEPTWNFCKYLVNERGELAEFFGSKIKPDNADFQAALKK